MEWLTSLGSMSPPAIAVALSIYFYNLMAQKYLDERKEMLQTLLAERKEEHEKLERLLDRYDNRVIAITDELARSRAEDHALRGKMQELLTRVEIWMRGGGSNG